MLAALALQLTNLGYCNLPSYPVPQLACPLTTTNFCCHQHCFDLLSSRAGLGSLCLNLLVVAHPHYITYGWKYFSSLFSVSLRNKHSAIWCHYFKSFCLSSFSHWKILKLERQHFVINIFCDMIRAHTFTGLTEELNMRELAIVVLRQNHTSLYPVVTMVAISCKLMRANLGLQRKSKYL